MSRLTVPEVAAELHCNNATVRRLINRPGGLRASKPAGRWLIDSDDLETYIQSQSNQPTPTTRRRRRRVA